MHVSEDQMIAGLLSGDEEAFRTLVVQHNSALISIVSTIVNERSIAEEVAQETWLAVIRKLESFEQRSSLRTWIFGIALNLARKRIRKDSRTELWETLSSPHRESERHEIFAEDGRWAKPPSAWRINPEEHAQQRELLKLVGEGLETLPPEQKLVVQLRDIEGFSGPDVCEILDVSSSNQRVLLHRARSSIRIYVESKLRDSP